MKFKTKFKMASYESILEHCKSHWVVKRSNGSRRVAKIEVSSDKIRKVLQSSLLHLVPLGVNAIS